MLSIAFPIIGYKSKNVPLTVFARLLLQAIGDFSLCFQTPNLQMTHYVLYSSSRVFVIIQTIYGWDTDPISSESRSTLLFHKEDSSWEEQDIGLNNEENFSSDKFLGIKKTNNQ